MKNATRLMLGGMFWAAVVALIGLGAAFSTPAQAQATGKNAVYDSGGNCSPCQKSSAFIDASVFVTSPPPPNRNFCGVLNFMLTLLNGIIPSFGAVIDARGLNSGNTSMTCTTANPSPWAGISSPPPSTILLLPQPRLPTRSSFPRSGACRRTRT
jgi:hypothetical protein